ncbi:MAG TPA: fibronectin type III domain-containing protein, partial [Verrucomicrobiae bacterium]|nr:fibronectin type III domain-containing protein [Verrucomicrobiae bacterium]
MPSKGTRWVFACVLAFGLTSPLAALKADPNYILKSGDYWSFWDLGFEPDPDWMSPYYEDYDWGVGSSPLGFGEPYISTQAAGPGIVTAYFRTYFFLDTTPAGPLTLRVRRDDGVIVYWNGFEVFRNNMPDGPVDDTTRAVTAVEATSFLEVTVDPFFADAYNVIAAEVHQADPFSSDLVFDLEFIDGGGGNTRNVRVTNPPDASTFAIGSDVTVSADAGPAAEVTAVNFYQGGTLLETDATPPYETILRSVQPSNYVVRAVALFNDSTSLTSAPVRFTAAAAAVTRGPYLQSGTPTSVIVKWRTDFGSDSVVRYGLTPGDLDFSATAPAVTVEHEVQLTGLTPDTQYYYSIGSSAGVQAGGNDFYFLTAPSGPKPTRIWVIGDSGGVAAGDPGALL